MSTILHLEPGRILQWQFRRCGSEAVNRLICGPFTGKRAKAMPAMLLSASFVFHL